MRFQYLGSKDPSGVVHFLSYRLTSFHINQTPYEIYLKVQVAGWLVEIPRSLKAKYNIITPNKTA